MTGLLESLYGWSQVGLPAHPPECGDRQVNRPGDRPARREIGRALARQTSAATFTILPEMLLTHAVGIVVLILAAALGIAMMTRQRRFLAMGAWAILSGSL